MRLIDRKFADPFEESDMEFWSFKVLSDASCKQMKFHPKEVSSIRRRLLVRI